MMVWSHAELEDEATAADIQRMMDHGAPIALGCRVRKLRWSPLELLDEPSTNERAAQRRAARRVFQVYCLARGRSGKVSVAPLRPGRCLHCGGMRSSTWLQIEAPSAAHDQSS